MDWWPGGGFGDRCIVRNVVPSLEDVTVSSDKEHPGFVEIVGALRQDPVGCVLVAMGRPTLESRAYRV